jgi:tetratricopeptide (TPR) repeat protein
MVLLASNRRVCENEPVHLARSPIFAIPAAAALLLGACASPPAPGRTHLGAMLETGEPELDTTQAGRSDEDRAKARALLEEGVRLREAGDLAASQQALEQALKLDASLARAHIEWAVTAEALGAEHELISAHYQLGARLAPQDAPAQIVAAAWSARQGDAVKALEGYDRALAADPRSVEAWSRRGDLLLSRGDAEAAVASFERARLVDDSFVPALIGLADAAERARRLEVAEGALKALVERFPQVALYRTRLISFYRRTGQATKANAAERELERLQPKDPRKLRELRGRR